MKHSRELRGEVVRRRQAGETVPDLSRDTGVPRSTIRWWVGEKTRVKMVASSRTDRKRLTDETRAAIIRRLNAGMPARTVAILFGLNEQTVRRVRRVGLRPIMAVRPKREWVDNARCRNDEPGLFFPSDTLHYARDVADAKSICNRCPVIDDCLVWAIDRGEHGIWGGTTDDERREMRRTA